MPLFHELFLNAVHSHEESAPRTRMFCRVRAAIMPRSLVASFALKNQKKTRFAWKPPYSFNLLAAAPETTFLYLGPNSSKAPFLRARLFVNESTLAAPEYSCSDDVGSGGLILHFTGFSLTQRAELFCVWGCKSHFYGAELRRLNRERFSFIPPEQWGVRSDARGKTHSWSPAGIWVVLMEKRFRTGGVLQQKARSLLHVVNCAKWLEYLRQTCA